MFILLFVVWIIFNGNLTLEIALFGLGVSAAVYAFACFFLDFSIKKDIRCMKKAGIFLWFACALLIEIIKANLTTAKWILQNRYDIEPVLVTFDMEFKTEICRVLYANAITLTPGTITVKQEGNIYTVHALEKSYADDINGGKLAEILYKLEENV